MGKNNLSIKINTEYYQMDKRKDLIKMGCKVYSIAEWIAYAKEEMANTDLKASEFWKLFLKEGE